VRCFFESDTCAAVRRTEGDAEGKRAVESALKLKYSKSTAVVVIYITKRSVKEENPSFFFDDSQFNAKCLMRKCEAVTVMLVFVKEIIGLGHI
jgi:hypothetical protein